MWFDKLTMSGTSYPLTLSLLKGVSGVEGQSSYRREPVSSPAHFLDCGFRRNDGVAQGGRVTLTPALSHRGDLCKTRRQQPDVPSPLVETFAKPLMVSLSNHSFNPSQALRQAQGERGRTP